MKDFELMLQLHAEGDEAGGNFDTAAGGEAAPAYNEVNTPDPVQPQEPQIETQPQSQPQPAQPEPTGPKPTFAIRVDARTGRREIVSFADENEDNSLQNPNNNIQYEQGNNAQPQYNVVNPQNQAPNNVQTDLNIQDIVADESNKPLFDIPSANPVAIGQQKPAEYQSAAELLADINNGTVDEARIPMSMAFQYAAYKNEMQKQAAQQQAQQAAQAPNVDEARKDFFLRVNQIAHAQALKDSGLTEEQLSVAEYSDDVEIQEKVKYYNSLLAFNRQNIINSVQRTQMEQKQAAEAQRTFMNEVRSEIQHISETEKNFADINRLMATLYMSMPYRDAQRYAAAVNAFNSNNMTPQQAQDLKEYYEKTRVQYYASKNGVNAGYNRNQFPKVENAGNGNLQRMSESGSGVTKELLRNTTDYRVKRDLIGRIVANMDRRNR